MPLRANIMEEFLSAIEGLVERPKPAPRQPMRGAGGAGPQAGPDLEAARRAAGPARASEAGHAAIAQEFESLIRQSQVNPEVRYRGELRPDIQSPPPGAPPPLPPTGLQNAPLSTAQLRSVQERFGRQAQRPPSAAFERALARSEGRAAPARTPALQPPQFQYEARQYPNQPGWGVYNRTNDSWATTHQTPLTEERARAAAVDLQQKRNAPLSTAQLRSVQERFGQRVQRMPPVQTPLINRRSAAGRRYVEQARADMQQEARDRMTSLGAPRLPTPAQTTTRQALTPSQATQPQIGGTRTPAPRSAWDAPNTRRFFDTHLRRQLGMNPQEFEQYYFAGFARNPSVSVAGNNLHLDASVRAPQDMIAPGRNGGPEVRIPAGTYMGMIRRQIMPQQREVYNAYFALDSQYQGLGIARTVFKNQIDVYRRMGNIDRVTVSAGLDGGGHTWARFGFVPDLNTWQGLRNTLLSRLRGITNLPPAQRAIAEQLIRSDDPYAIRELSGMPMAPGARSSDLGRRLLGGTGWRGTLDLRNPRDMNYFDAYVTPRPRQ